MQQAAEMAVRNLVKKFLTQHPKWSDVNQDTGGLSLCDEASQEFFDWLTAKKVSAAMLWVDMVERDGNDIVLHDAYPKETRHRHHCVVVVLGHVVDLTPRQYDASLPFPFIWKTEWRLQETT